MYDTLFSPSSPFIHTLYIHLHPPVRIPLLFYIPYIPNAPSNFDWRHAADEARQDNATVKVVNTATRGTASVSITGTASPVDAAYAPGGGAFKVEFPGTPAAVCEGPNYIVQGTLFVLFYISVAWFIYPWAGGKRVGVNGGKQMLTRHQTRVLRRPRFRADAELVDAVYSEPGEDSRAGGD